jgi:hypothetical protein
MTNEFEKPLVAAAKTALFPRGLAFYVRCGYTVGNPALLVRRAT